MSRSFSPVLMLAALCIVIVYLFPVYWMYISGFKTSGEIFSRPPTFFPENATLDAFAYIFQRERMGRYLANSLIIAVATTALTLVLGSLSAYALARLRSLWVDAALIFVLVAQTFPEALLATPMFVIFRELGILNTTLAVVLATATKTLPFALVVLRPVFLQVPKELEEAAEVDGCTEWSAFFLVILPVARSGVIVVGALSFIMAYGEFVYPSTLLSSRELHPATVGLYSFVGAEYADWHNVMAFAAVFATPVILLFILLQKQIVSGLTAGALK